MEMPKRTNVQELITKTKEAINSLEQSFKTVENMAYIEQEIGEKLDQFEDPAARLIDLIQDCFSASGYMCGCGSELKVDRENQDEEPACCKCAPTEDEYNG